MVALLPVRPKFGQFECAFFVPSKMLTTVKSAVLRPRTSRSSLRILTRRLLATQAKDAQHESEVADVQSTQLRTPTIEVNDPSIKLRIGTVQLPPELQKRIYAVLHGNLLFYFYAHFNNYRL